jgi:hypothetical protein
MVPLPTSGLAIASLVSGIIGWILLPILGSIVAIVLGNSARKETRATPPRAGGDGLATAGIILGWVQVGLLASAVCIIAVLMMLGPMIGNTFSTINSSLAQ